MKKFLLIPVFIFTMASACAQQKKAKFQSINTLQFLSGESPVKAGFGSTNGITFSSWFMGVGVGLDYYHFKSLPVFADGRRYFGNQSRVFVYGDIGGNLPFHTQPGKEFYNYINYHFIAGIYAAAGIGYRFPAFKRTSLIFSLGNSYKSLNAKTKDHTYTPCFMAPCPASFRDYHFYFYRLMVRAGLMF